MIEYNTLTKEEYIDIMSSVSWKISSERLLEISLKNGINVKYVLDNNAIGMASFVTNGGYAGLIMDVVVKPDFQGKGYGKALIKSLIKYIQSQMQDGEEMMIQLLSAPGKEKFYSNFGFKAKKEVAEEGMYMWLKKGD